MPGKIVTWILAKVDDPNYEAHIASVAELRYLSICSLTQKPPRHTSKRQRFEILARDKFRCHYCGRTAREVKLHVDHIVPVAKGGLALNNNLVACCVDCNLGKSDKIFRIKQKHRPLLRIEAQIPMQLLPLDEMASNV